MLPLHTEESFANLLTNAKDERLKCPEVFESFYRSQ